MQCPCCSQKTFATCCGPYLDGQAAPTPEALMRSRFTAFSRNDVDYLLASLAKEQQGAFKHDDVRRWNAQTQWLTLEILDTQTAGDCGQVRFRATFRRAGLTQSLTECSRFLRREGRWYYQDGEHETPDTIHVGVKTGRNASCPCGSGKKFKKCCG